METVESPRERRQRPPGALAWRQYEVTLRSGRTAILGFSLADPRHATMARIRREHDASNLGLLVVLDDPESMEEAVLWFQSTTSLSLLPQDDDRTIGAEVTALLPRYFAVFFDEVKDLAPDLADILLAPVPQPGDRNFH